VKRPDVSARLVLLASLAVGCHASPDSDPDPDPDGDTAPTRPDCEGAHDLDQDCDGAIAGVDCDDGDPNRAPGRQEVFGDGIDQDCDGSDHPTVSLREIATARYNSDRPGAQLGWTVACGPDRGGDGMGDLAAIASAFGMNSSQHNFAAALPGPVPGEHSVEEVLDLRVEPNELTLFDRVLGLVDQVHGGGVIVENTGTYELGLTNLISFVTESGPLDETTPTFGWESSPGYGPAPYAGPADLTGDGVFDFALGPVVLEAMPEGWVDLTNVGRLALEPNQEYGSGAENAVGDLNHDGQDDLLFSWVVPPVWLVFGPVGDVPARRDGPRVAQFWPEDADLATAENLDAEIGDVSGDGIDDLLIANMWYGADPSSPPSTGIGAVHVWFGPLEAGRYTTATANVRFVGELPGAWTGRGLALGDFDGDGTKSLVVGAPASKLWLPGLVYVFDEPLQPGELTAADAVAIYRGEEPNATTGFSIAACDTDRDGRDELVVGAPRVDYSGEIRDAGVFYWLDEVP